MSGLSDAWRRLAEALLELRALLDSLRGRGGLRHGLSYVRVSDLVEQARCEARLEAMLGSERSVDERVRLVEELVRYTLGATRRLTERRISEGILFLDAPVAGVVANVPIVGRPKALIIRDGIVEGIVYASISSSPQRFYETDRVRAAAFCAALHASPLPLAETPLYIHVKGVDRRELGETLAALREAVKRGDRLFYPGVHIAVCDPNDSIARLEPLLSYWLGLRDATRRPGPWCRECPLRDVCPHARS